MQIIYKGIAEDSKGLVYILPTGRKGDLMITDENGNRRAIRYTSNIQSIYYEDQGKHAKLPALMLRDGYLIIDGDDKTLAEFLEKHPLNGVKFAKVDNEADAKEMLEQNELILDIQAAIRSKGKEKYGEVTLASLLSVKSRKTYTSDKLAQMGPFQVRQALYNMVENVPEEFIDNQGNVNCFDSNDFIIKDLVLKALSEKIIDINLSGTILSWGNMERIIDIPVGKDYLDYTADWLQTEDGEKAKKAIAIELEEVLS